MRLLLIGLLLSTTLIAQERVHSVAPAPAPPHANRVCSPGVDAGDYVYISGQGPLRPDGSSPATFNEQVRQVLDNVKAIVESSGLTMDHVVYTQVYLSDISQFEELNKVFAESFPKTPPARAVLGVARIPAPPIQINAVAVRDLKNRRAVYPPNEKKENSFSPGILTHDRLFVSSMAGADPTTGKIPADPAEQVDLALDRVEAVLKAAGLELSNMVFVNPYLTSDLPSKVMNEHYAKRFEFGNTPARATIEVSSLPGGAHIEYTGVAVRDLSQRRRCVPRICRQVLPPVLVSSPATPYIARQKADSFQDRTAACTPLPRQTQLRQTMRNQLDNLEEAGMEFSQVVSTTVYLDDLDDAASFDEVYGQYFGPTMPACTTIQQIASADRKADKDDHYPDLEQVSLIAVRNKTAK